MTRTEINAMGSVICPDCGAYNVASALDELGYVDCKCGKSMQTANPQAYAGDALKACGYILSLDYDDTLLVDSFYELPAAVSEWIFNHQRRLVDELQASGRAARHCFMGGSRAGDRHGLWCVTMGRRVYIRIGRAHWETYEFRDRNDPRLFFVGRSTSKAKAKQGVYVQTGTR